MFPEQLGDKKMKLSINAVVSFDFDSEDYPKNNGEQWRDLEFVDFATAQVRDQIEDGVTTGVTIVATNMDTGEEYEHERF